MSKVRINDLAREMEVKSKQILDILAELGLATGKTHSSSLEEYEAEKVRVHLNRGTKPSAASTSTRGSQGITPKIDLSHVSKPGDVLKAILANKQKEEQEARQSHAPARPQTPPPTVVKPPVAPPVVAAAPPAAPAAPAPRKIVPQPRSAPPVVVAPPAPPAIASRPPVGPVVAKAPAGTVVVARPTVVVAPPPATVVVKAPATPAKSEEPARPAEAVVVKPPVAPAGSSSSGRCSGSAGSRAARAGRGASSRSARRREGNPCGCRCTRGDRGRSGGNGLTGRGRTAGSPCGDAADRASPSVQSAHCCAHGICAGDGQPGCRRWTSARTADLRSPPGRRNGQWTWKRSGQWPRRLSATDLGSRWSTGAVPRRPAAQASDAHHAGRLCRPRRHGSARRTAWIWGTARIRRTAASGIWRTAARAGRSTASG